MPRPVGAAATQVARRWPRRTRPTPGTRPAKSASAADDRRRHRRRAAGASDRLGRAVRPAQVARAVDVPARQADELLLAQRLRDRIASARSGSPDGAPRPGAEPSSSSIARRNGQTQAFGDRPSAAATGAPCVRMSRGRRVVGFDRNCGGGPVAGSSYTRPPLPRGWNGAESSTFRVLPSRTGGARLRRQSRADCPLDARSRGPRPRHGTPTARDPAAARRLSPGAAPHQALHVPPPDQRRGRAPSGSTTSSASSPIARCRSRSATSRRRRRSATPASRRTSSAPTKTDAGWRAIPRCRSRAVTHLGALLTCSPPPG